MKLEEMTEAGVDSGTSFTLNGVQTGLLVRWKNLLDKNDLNAYFLNVRTSINDPAINAPPDNILVPFHVVEKIYKFYKQPEFRESYKEIFTMIGNELLLRDVLNTFNVEFFKTAELVLESGIRLERTRRYTGAIELLTKTYDQVVNEADKIVQAARVCLCELFSGGGKNAKVVFIRRCADRNMLKLKEECSGLPIKDFSIIFKSIQPSVDEVLDILNRYYFDEKLFFLKDISAQKSNIIFVLQLLWNIYGTETNFLVLYEKWLKLFQKAVEKDLAELAFFMVMPIAHIYSNLSQTQAEWKKLNDELYRPLSAYISGQAAPAYNIKPVEKKSAVAHDKIKIGFVYNRMVLNSPFKVLYSLLKGLKEYNTVSHELYVYDLEVIDKSISDPEAVRMIEDLGVFYRSNHRMIGDSDKWYYYSHLAKCMTLREAVVSDGIDVLIDTGGYEQDVFLFATRSAPVQIYWSHGNHVYDVEGVDYRIMHAASDVGKVLLEDHEFQTFPVAMDKMFYKPPVDMEKIKAIRCRFPEGTVIMGSIGRMIKVDSVEYLEAVAEIMKCHPNTVYLACGPGGTDGIKKKIRELGIAERFYCEGGVDPHVYGYVIDIYLDTFPLGGGEALNEYLAKGHGYVPAFRDALALKEEEITSYESQRVWIINQLKTNRTKYFDGIMSECRMAYGAEEKIIDGFRKINRMLDTGGLDENSAADEVLSVYWEASANCLVVNGIMTSEEYGRRIEFSKKANSRRDVWFSELDLAINNSGYRKFLAKLNAFYFQSNTVSFQESSERFIKMLAGFTEQ